MKDIDRLEARIRRLNTLGALVGLVLLFCMGAQLGDQLSRQLESKVPAIMVTYELEREPYVNVISGINAMSIMNTLDMGGVEAAEAHLHSTSTAHLSWLHRALIKCRIARLKAKQR